MGASVCPRRRRFSTPEVLLPPTDVQSARTTGDQPFGHQREGRLCAPSRNALLCRKEGATVDWIFRRWGRSLTVPSLTSLPTSDRHCFLDFGGSGQTASSLRTEDQSALRDPVVPRGLLRRAGRPAVPLPVEVGPGFPWG